MVNNNGVYALFQNKIFLRFDEWLESNGIDFRELSETATNSYIAVYTHFIQSQLIDLMEQYRNAD